MITNFIDCTKMFINANDLSSVPAMANCSSISVSSGSSVSDSSHTSGAPLQKRKSKGPDKTKTPLPLDFEPQSYTVLCGRSRECYEWMGNRRFRVICNMYLQQYLDALGKLEKSRIVTTVMKAIRQGNKAGVFVTYESGRYYEVSQRTAREKVGGFFRDSLPAEYRSSAKAKLARKRAETCSSSSCNSSYHNHQNNHLCGTSSNATDTSNEMPLSFPLTEIFAPQQVASSQPQQVQQLPPVETIDEMESLEECPDFLTGGIFANEPLFMLPAINTTNTTNNSNQQGAGHCNFVGASFFDVECV